MLKISKWRETFENSDSRKRQRLKCYMQPSGTDSNGYIELMTYGEKGVMAYGVFVALCQWAATCPSDIRGMLCKTDRTPLDIRQISGRLRMDPGIVSAAIDLLSSPDIGWLMKESSICGDAAEKSATDVPPENPEKTLLKPIKIDQFEITSASSLPLSADSMPKNSGFVQGEGEGEGEGEGSAPDKSGIPPADEIIAAFDSTFGTTSRWTDKRRKALTARWRDLFWRDNWEAALERAGPSAFLRGANDRTWAIDLEFFLRPDTVTKILEGKYDNRTSGKTNTASQQREQATASAFDRIRAAAAASGGNQGGTPAASSGAIVFCENDRHSHRASG